MAMTGMKSRKFMVKVQQLNKWEQSLDSKHLLKACRQGALAEVRAFLTRSDLKASDERKYTALHWACVSGNKEVVDLLLEYGAMVTNTRDGQTPVHIACLMGHSHIVASLASRGYDLKVSDNQGMTPMAITAVNGDETCLGTLRAWKVALEPTLLHHAAGAGHMKYIQRLINEPEIDINSQDAKGQTALMHAAANDRQEIAKEFIRRGGVNWACVDECSRNVLHHAANGGSAAMMQLLVDSCAECLPEIINKHDVYTTNNVSFLIRGRDRG
jgi:ankyrin repeat protein